MSAEDFKIACEINSLMQKKKTLLDEILSEKKRITFIQKNREERQTERDNLTESLKKLKTNMQQVENDIASFQITLTKDQTHLNSVSSNEQLKNLESSILHVKEKLESLEDKGLELLEGIESSEFQAKECEDFLKGSAETLNEIQIEVDIFTKSHQKKIEILNSRIDLLLDELPPSFKDRIERVFKRNIQISSFTRIISGACEFCKFSVTKADESNIEDKLQLKSCQSCGRIFIPQQASY